MSITAFAGGLSDGLDSGVKFGLALNKGRDVAGVRKANEILAQMETMGPVPVTPGNRGQGILPEGGEAQQGNPTGYDGLEWAEVKKQYTMALRGVTDPQMLQMAEKRLVDLEKGKVLQYGQAAMAAMDAGDLEKAGSYLAGISYFMFPGETPVVQVGQDGTVFFRDQDGQGMALKKEQLADMMHQFVNFEGWRELTFDRERHADDMAYRNTVLASQIAARNAQIAIDAEELALRREQNRIGNTKSEAEIAQIEANMKRAEEEFRQRTEKADLERFDAMRSETQTAFDSLLSDPATLNKVLDSAAPTDELSGQVIPEPEHVATARTEVLDTQVGRSERQQYREAMQWTLDSDPELRHVANAMMTGIIKGGDSAVAQDIANMVFGFVFQTPDDPNYFYDPDEGVLRVGQPGNQDTYAIGEKEQQTLNALLGVAPQELMAAAPQAQNQTGIPMEAP
jgi:hypothetical protein